MKSNPFKSTPLKATREFQLQDENKISNNNNQIHAGDLKNRIQNPHLNPDWTFDNFVLGKANQLARAAAQQTVIIRDMVIIHFLYGGVGLGNPLIHAVESNFLDKNRLLCEIHPCRIICQ